MDAACIFLRGNWQRQKCIIWLSDNVPEETVSMSNAIVSKVGQFRMRHYKQLVLAVWCIKDEIEGKKTSLLAQMYDRNRILVMLPIMWLNIS